MKKAKAQPIVEPNHVEVSRIEGRKAIGMKHMLLGHAGRSARGWAGGLREVVRPPLGHPQGPHGRIPLFGRNQVQVHGGTIVFHDGGEGAEGVRALKKKAFSLGGRSLVVHGGGHGLPS
jgi:hypothetical protein